MINLYYIDPGSGLALINVVIGLFLSVIYSIRRFIYKITGKKEELDNNYAILSEGNQYKYTFLPIVQAFENKGVRFNYYTLDVHDEFLKNHPTVMTPKFLGFGFWGKWRAGRIKARKLICTTPNIGNKAYGIRRSPHIQEFIHVFHSVCDISMYKRGSLDSYDTVIVGAEFQIEGIRQIESRFNLKKKKISNIGIPYLDYFSKNFENIEETNNTVLIASSWGKKGLLVNYGEQLLNQLKNTSYQIVVRPHPQSYISEPEFINDLTREFSGSNIVFDKSIDFISAFKNSRILISDTSSIRMDYYYLTQKPVITLEIDQSNFKGFEAEFVSEIWPLRISEEIGSFVRKDQISNILNVIEDLTNKGQNIKINLKSEDRIQNIGCAGKKIVELITDEIHI